MSSLTLTNARIVTRNEVIMGTIDIEHGHIVSVDRGNTSVLGSQDMEGDYLMPGLIELHTDNMEKSFTPRPGVKWPSIPAAVSHDVQVVGAGITTVFDALSVGDIMHNSARLSQLKDMSETILKAKDKGLLRADHFLHMRCELSYETVVDIFKPFIDHPLIRLVSLMDHAPGQRQFVDIKKYREYYQGKYHFSDDQMEIFIEKHKRISDKFSQAHRDEIVGICRENDLPMASHDDATKAHVDEAQENGIKISEFPTTEEAAIAARDNGLYVLMGAPNMVRGQSHSGNISARELAAKSALNILSSDYFPGSTLQGIFAMHKQVEGITLPQAVATATINPAEAAGMTDRGELRPSKRADILRVRMSDDMPITKEVWGMGSRIF